MIPDHVVGDFFAYDDGVDDKIIFFCTPEAKTKIKCVDTFYGDGTFRVVPNPFYQLYSLHIDLSNDRDSVNFVPVLYILLPNKSQDTYVRLFTTLKNQFAVNIKVFRCDYEISTINAVKSVYPEVEVKGCFYHFNNAVWRMSKKMGLNNTPEGPHITKLSANLALLPKALIPETFLAIWEEAPDTDKFNQFKSYFVKQWMELVTYDVFCCYGQTFRTTNAIEGWHRRINGLIPKKPSLYFFIQLLKKEACTQNIKLKQNDCFTKGKKRRKMQLEKDQKIEKIIQITLKEEISTTECLDRICRVKRA